MAGVGGAGEVDPRFHFGAEGVGGGELGIGFDGRGEAGTQERPEKGGENASEGEGGDNFDEGESDFRF